MAAGLGYSLRLGRRGHNFFDDAFHCCREGFSRNHDRTLACGIRLVLFGLFRPFAAAFMNRFGVRKVVVCALAMIASGLAFRIVDKQGNIRRHIAIFVGETMVRGLRVLIGENARVQIVGALSGG